MKRHNALAIAAGVGLCACGSDYNVRPDPDIINPLDQLGDPAILVDPPTLDFGQVEVIDGLTQVQLVTISNVGEGDLHIQELSLQDPGTPFDFSALGSVLLAPGEITELQVSFDPGASGLVGTTLLIDSDDPLLPVATVSLLGEGIAPAIEVTPESYDFGTAWVGCENQLELTVTNVGSAELVVEDFGYFTGSNELLFGGVEDSNGSEPGLLSLEPEEFQEIYVSYEPIDDLEDIGYLAIDSNDPDRPTVQVSQWGNGAAYGDQLDVFEQPIQGMSDILFVVDKSGSMTTDLANVIANFGVFVSTMVNLDSDFHVAFVVRDDGCINGSDLFIDGTFSESGAVATVSAMIEAPAGGNTERGFTLAEAALAEAGPGGCNEGFLREDAELHIVGVSDEPEQSANPWSTYVTLFQGYKRNPDDVVIHAVGGDYPSGCGDNQAYTGFYEATVATGGQFLSICASDWASHLAALAEASSALLDSFALTTDPVPETIRVRVDGVTHTLGWSYDEASNSVKFDSDHIPEGGATVEIDYTLRGDCEM
jgi:hypothetical protein